MSTASIAVGAGGAGAATPPPSLGMGGGSGPPLTGSPGAGGNGIGGGAGASVTPGPPLMSITSMTFDVTTQNQKGNYAPRNVGAIWIENGAGKFIKTLKVWAATRGRYLTKFNTEAGGNRVDAVTSATISSFASQHAVWNLKDVSGSPVPDGPYTAIIEVTDHDGTGKFAQVDFMKTSTPMSLMPVDQQYYTAMRLSLQ